MAVPTSLLPPTMCNLAMSGNHRQGQSRLSLESESATSKPRPVEELHPDPRHIPRLLRQCSGPHVTSRWIRRGPSRRSRRQRRRILPIRRRRRRRAQDRPWTHRVGGRRHLPGKTTWETRHQWGVRPESTAPPLARPWFCRRRPRPLWVQSSKTSVCTTPDAQVPQSSRAHRGRSKAVLGVSTRVGVPCGPTRPCLPALRL
mmetsp:Transcript_5720/g.14269  ORF Transcript_5720/g.14269 Transcript_5720/m.14269 type:complete len:201 (+) Transcript_5720:264-866(+)